MDEGGNIHMCIIYIILTNNNRERASYTYNEADGTWSDQWGNTFKYEKRRPSVR